jgi:acyl-CoA synthetase (AMP-forming)/AMP-acid ligase II
MALEDRCGEFADGETLIARITRWAERKPDAPAYTFVDYGSVREGRSTTLTWAEVHRRASSTAARLRRSAAPVDRVALLLPPGLDYLTTMLGAFYARLIAVPRFCPEPPGQHERLIRAYTDADPAVAVTVTGSVPAVRSFLGETSVDLVTAATLAAPIVPGVHVRFTDPMAFVRDPGRRPALIADGCPVPPPASRPGRGCARVTSARSTTASSTSPAGGRI